MRQAPPWKELKLEELLQAGLREAANSSRPEVKFWALFINELGHRSAAPVPTCSAIQTPASTGWDPIQLQFLLARLAANLDARSRRTAAVLRPDVVRAAWSGQGGGADGCSSSTAEDYAAVAAISNVWRGRGGDGRFRRQLRSGGAASELRARAAEVHRNLRVAGARHPDRGRQADPDQGSDRRDPTTIRDRVNIKETWAQYVNCARRALNAAGLDMSVPDAGPVKDVKVWWNIEQGRDTLVFFPNAAAGPSGGGFSSTDDDGVAKALITGFPQEADLSRRRIVAMPKPASVRASAQIKSTRFKDAEGVLGTAGDYGSLILSFFGGDFPPAPSSGC